MSEQPAHAIPEGYQVLRPLSVRSGSSVHLARKKSGEYCALKFQTVIQTDRLAELEQHRLILQSLNQFPGFIPVTHWGVRNGTASPLLWEEMPLADPMPATDSSMDSYVPRSLAAWLAENGPASTEAVLEWGTSLAGALEQLHNRGLLHRDVKPANILFYSGRVALADYGSVGVEGSVVQFPGTEGYVPPDGVGSRATDVFALGRTLYEAWTGLDRFRFPSLPHRLKAEESWPKHGWLLNECLLRAADSRPSRRYASVTGLKIDLEKAARGRKQISRRKLLALSSAAALAGCGFYVWRNLPSHRAVWRRLPPKKFGYENWLGNPATCDWDNRCVYSVNADSRGTLWQRYQFTNWTHSENFFPQGPKRGVYPMLHPDLKDLWAVEMVSGQVVRVDPPGRAFNTVAHELVNQLDFTGPIYWNSVTRRIGKFGGYGDFHNSLQRREFNLPAGRWEMAADAPGVQPWPRNGPILIEDRPRQRLFLFGGLGNPSGRQSEEVGGLRDYDGRFYPLNDLWELDLRSLRWQKLLAVQNWNPRALKAAVFHEELDAVLFLTGSEKLNLANAAFHVLHKGQSGSPMKIPSSGESIRLFEFWTLLVEPATGHLWVFADEGVFAVEMQKV